MKYWWMRYYNKQDQEGGGEGDGGQGGSGGAADTNWRDGLGDLKDDVAFKDFADLPSLASNYKDLQSHLGNSIRIPSGEADDTQWGEFRNKLHAKVPGLLSIPKEGDAEGLAAFRKAMGVPDDKAAYEYDKKDYDMINDDRLGFLQEIAHKAGLTPTQFKTVLNEVAGVDSAEIEAANEKVKASRQEVYKQWGEAFEDRVAGVNNFLEQSGAPEELVNLAKENRLGGKSLMWLHNLAKAVSGEGGNLELQGQKTNQGGKLDPQEAMARADELYTQIMAMNQGDPRYDALVKKRFEYIKMANPGASTNINELRASANLDE